MWFDAGIREDILGKKGQDANVIWYYCVWTILFRVDKHTFMIWKRLNYNNNNS